MTLENYIYSSIFAYPSLYYKENWEFSKREVLNQLFLVISNGVEYVNPKNEIGKGHFNNSGFKVISKKDKKRIFQLESIVTVSPLSISDFDTVWGDRNKKYTMFLSDFLKLKLPYFNQGDNLPEDFSSEKYKNYKVICEYPSSNRSYRDKLKRLGRWEEWSPYPFSIKYCPFWNSEKDCFITKEMIAPDWVEGIIWIYTQTKNWFENDEKFLADNYYNFSLDVGKNCCVFTQSWNKKKSVEDLCKSYEIPFKNYQTPKDVAVDICLKRRHDYIQECDKILNYYK
jgi:hypothetical protein